MVVNESCDLMKGRNEIEWASDEIKFAVIEQKLIDKRNK